MLNSKLGDEATASSNAQRMVNRGNKKRTFFTRGILSIGRNHNITHKKKAPLLKFSPSSKIYGEPKLVFQSSPIRVLTIAGDSVKLIGSGGVAQSVRACGSYPQCPGFKSLHRHQSYQLLGHCLMFQDSGLK